MADVDRLLPTGLEAWQTDPDWQPPTLPWTGNRCKRSVNTLGRQAYPMLERS
jgi:hypothetical protein